MEFVFNSLKPCMLWCNVTRTIQGQEKCVCICWGSGHKGEAASDGSAKSEFSGKLLSSYRCQLHTSILDKSFWLTKTYAFSLYRFLIKPKTFSSSPVAQLTSQMLDLPKERFPQPRAQEAAQIYLDNSKISPHNKLLIPLVDEGCYRGKWLDMWCWSSSLCFWESLGCADSACKHWR